MGYDRRKTETIEQKYLEDFLTDCGLPCGQEDDDDDDGAT